MKAKVAHVTTAFSPVITAQGSKYVFRIDPTTDDYGTTIVEYAVKKKGFKKFGIIADSGVFGQNQANSYEKALGEFGLKAVSRQKFNLEDRDFTGQLLTIQRAGAEVLCLSTTEIEAGLIAKQARSLGMKFQFLSPQAYAPYVKSGGTKATDGSLFPVAYIGPEESDRARKFAEKFKAKHKYEAMVHNIWGYDGAYLIAMAMKKAHPNITRETFRDAFASHCNVTLVQGTYCFDERGEGISRTKIAVVRGGKIYPVK
jgi:branched-chain amino acid transport system substrate-binding protein